MYNITMVYKTRKNKAKLFKKQFGGFNNLNSNNSNTNVPPTIKDNIKKFVDIWLQMFNNVSMYTLETVENKLSDTSKSFGIDPTKSFKDELVKASQKAEKINDVLDTPEGKVALAKLTALFDKITKNVLIPSSEKLTEGIIENIQPILIRGQNAVFALLSASPFGAIIDIPRFVSESLGVVEKSVSLADDVLNITQDTVDKVKAEKSNFDSVVSEFSSLIDQANTQVSSGLDTVQQQVNNYGKDIMKTSMPNLQDINKYGKDITSTGVRTGISNLQDINNSLKNYQKEAMMVGGRLHKSQLEFLSPNINASKIMNQYGGKTRRKKHNYSNRKLLRNKN